MEAAVLISKSFQMAKFGEGISNNCDLAIRHTPQEENTSDSDGLVSDLTNKSNNNSTADLDSDATVQTPRRSNPRRQPRTVYDYRVY